MVNASNSPPAIGEMNICKQVALFVVHCGLRGFQHPSSGDRQKNSNGPTKILDPSNKKIGFWCATAVENIEIRPVRRPIMIYSQESISLKIHEILAPERDMPNSIQAQRKPAGKPKLGGYFCVDVLTTDELIARGMTPTELLAYLVLGAGTDEGNTVTRSGRLAISRTLACSRYEAGQIVERLIALGAVVSFEDDLEDRRDPTAARFRLLRLEGESTPAVTAILPNRLLRDGASTSALTVAARVGGAGALRELIEIARMPAGTVEPEMIGTLSTPTLRRFGSTHIARFDLFPMEGQPIHHPIRFSQFGSEIALLSGTGLIVHDLWTAIADPDGGTPALLRPIGSLLRGMPAGSGVMTRYRLLAWALHRLSGLEPGTISQAELMAEWRQEEAVIAVLPLGWPTTTVVAVPRLALRPDDAATRARAHSDALATQAATQGVADIVERHLPRALPIVRDLLRALEP